MTNIDILRIFIKILTYVSIFLVCFVFYKILKEIGNQTGDIEEKTKQVIDNTIKQNGSLTKQKQKLSKLGIMYRVKDYNLSPSWYVLARIAIGVCVTLLIWLLSEHFFISLIGIPIGYILTEVYFKRQNESDNKAIMMDLYNTYANLKIQMDAGIYIIDSIEYSHRNAINRRYKEALGELIINFSDKTIPMVEAINIFRNRFDSKDINKLSALLESCVLYGTQKAYTKDIMSEIQGILSASTISSEHDIESKAGLINFGFFAILIFIVVFSVVSNFNGLELF